ncbi:MAG: hypothetical protein P8X64_01315, partial [Anaerolineales bacterium]
AREPVTIFSVSQALFPEADGYHDLLALEEAAAHVEYLHARGLLCLENVDDIERETDVVLKFRRCEQTDFAPLF